MVILQNNMGSICGPILGPQKGSSLTLTCESFHVKRSNLVEVRARTDPDLPSLGILHVFQ